MDSERPIMNLPQVVLPVYNLVLPVSGQSIKYRPYTVKEEKIMLMAAQTNDEATQTQAIEQIIHACTGLAYSDLHPTDLEFLYIKLRSVSVGSVIPVSIDLPNDCEGSGESACPKSIPSSINLDLIKVENTDGLSRYEKKNESYIVMLNDTVGLAIKPNSNPGDFIFSSLDYVFDETNVYPKASFTEKEFVDWLDSSFTDEANKNISEFISAQPYVKYDLVAKCRVCGIDIKREISGLLGFFG